MKIEDTIKYIASIDDALAAGSVEFALATLEALATAAKAPAVNAEAARLHEAYSLMTRYALDGMVDPERENLLTDIRQTISDLSRNCLRTVRMVDDPALYYSIARVEAMHPDETIPALAEAMDKASLASLGLPDAPTTAQAEEISRKLFNRIWTTHPLNHADTDALGHLLTDITVPSQIKRHIAAALMLGLLEFQDEKRLQLLADAYTATHDKEPDAAMTALTCLLTAMWIHRDYKLRSKTRARLDALTEIPSWKRDVRTIYLEMARARDTERINRKIRDELMPGLMKLRPDLEKRMGTSGIIDPSAIEENPEWQEILDNSGITDKLRELSEIQEEGGDVMMAAMSNLKNFPFFHEVANWFLPFDTNHPAIRDNSPIASLVKHMPGMCDSDKYSLMLAIGMMPADRRKAFSEQVKIQGAGMAEMAAASRTDDSGTAHREAASLFVRTAYRFFKLFRRKGEFNDPFASPVNLAALPFTAPVLSDKATLELMAEFYFKRGYHNQALELFNRLIHSAPTTAQLFQKIGYCLQKQGDISGALEAYENSELLQSDSLWTLKRIAACHRALGNTEKAIEYYRRIEQNCPDDARIALTLGHCLLEAHRPAEALKLYFKAEYLNPDNHKTLRPIAWASLLTGDFDRSARYYNLIIEDSPEAGDFINAGHLEMARKHYHDAVGRYSRALAMMEFDTRSFLKAIADDSSVMISLGIDPFMTGIVSDAVMAENRSRRHPTS